MKTTFVQLFMEHIWNISEHDGMWDMLTQMKTTGTSCMEEREVMQNISP